MPLADDQNMIGTHTEASYG